METEVQGLTQGSGSTQHISKVGSFDDDDENRHETAQRDVSDDIKSQYECKMKLLLLTIFLLIAIIIIIVLCGVYAGAFDKYSDCQTCASSTAQNDTEIVIPDGNQFDFATTVCDGYRDLWDDPTLPLAQRNQIGRAIFQTPQKMQQAIELIKQGKTYNLYRPYSHDMPFFGDRYLNTTLICGYYPEWSAGSCTQEVKTNGIGNIGTQFDSFGHFFSVDLELNDFIDSNTSEAPPNENYVLFNNFRGNQVFNTPLGEADDGINYLGVQLLPTFFSRAIVVDVAGYKGVERLPNKYNITVSDFENALAAQDLSASNITKGDVVLTYTGWSTLYDSDPDLFYNWDETPGLSEAVVLDIIFDTNAMIIGSDNWGVDFLGGNEWGGHQTFLACGGGFIHEGLKLDEWVMDARNGEVPWIGAYVFQPLPVWGAVASPGKPVVFV